MTPLSIPLLASQDLCIIVEWGDKWLVKFNATKTKLLYFNRHRNPLLAPVEMNGIKLPEETSFRLLGLTFTSPLPRLFQGKWAPFIGFSVSLLLDPSCICKNLPFDNVWSTVPISGVVLPRSYVLDLLDRVQKRVVRLVGSGLSSDLQALPHRRDVTSLNLFYKYFYGKCSSELADLVPPKCVTVRSTSFSEQMYCHTVNSPM